MSKIRFAAAAMVAGLATATVAAPAFAYPDPQPSGEAGTAADGVVGLNQRVTLSGAFNTTCDWVATFAGQTPQGGEDDTSFSVDFANPGAGTHTLSITCSYEDPSDSGASTAAFAPKTAIDVITYTIQVGPTSEDGSGGGSGGGTGSDGGTGTGTGSGTGTGGSAAGALPDTGGSNLWLLAAGGSLVVAGGVAVAARRRQV